MMDAQPEAFGEDSQFRRRDLYRLVNHLKTKKITSSEIENIADEKGYSECSYGSKRNWNFYGGLIWAPIFTVGGACIAHKLGGGEVLGGLIGLVTVMSGCQGISSDNDEKFYDFLKQQYKRELEDYKEVFDAP